MPHELTDYDNTIVNIIKNGISEECMPHDPAWMLFNPDELSVEVYRVKCPGYVLCFKVLYAGIFILFFKICPIGGSKELLLQESLVIFTIIRYKEEIALEINEVIANLVEVQDIQASFNEDMLGRLLNET